MCLDVRDCSSPEPCTDAMARGNRKSTIFHDDEDRQRFLEVIEHAVGLYDLRVMAFCLMGNHYHVVLETPLSNLSDAMQFVNGVFAPTFQPPASTNRARLRGTVPVPCDRARLLFHASRSVRRQESGAGRVGRRSVRLAVEQLSRDRRALSRAPLAERRLDQMGLRHGTCSPRPAADMSTTSMDRPNRRIRSI